MSLLGLFLFVFFSIFPLVYLLVFPFLCSFLSFPQKYVCLCLFRFCHFPSVSISFNKISRFFCLVLFVFQHFLKTKSFFSWYLISFLVFLVSGISPCSNLHFDRPHSYTFVSRFFFSFCWLSFHVSCPLYVYSRCFLSWSTLLVVTLLFFVAKHFFSKKNFLSLLSLQDIHVSF